MDTTYNTPEWRGEIYEDTEAIIWSQKVNEKETWVLFVNTLLSYIGIIFWYFLFIKDQSLSASLSLEGITFLEIIILLVLAAVYILFTYTRAFIAYSMMYTIRPKYISFEWGVFRKNRIDIPFTDITAIQLVEYDNHSFSTIFFGTKTVYNIKKLNFELSEERPHITFEKIKDGRKVVALLHTLRDKNLR